MARIVSKAILVNRGISGVYELWADFENFPRFMKYIKSVTKTSDRTSRWVMEGPLGRDLKWDAETTVVETDRRIAWRSTHGDVTNSGEVRFTPVGPNQTEVELTLDYEAPGGKLGEIAADLFRNPHRRLKEDLQNFKDYAERGQQ